MAIMVDLGISNCKDNHKINRYKSKSINRGALRLLIVVLILFELLVLVHGKDRRPRSRRRPKTSKSVDAKGKYQHKQGYGPTIEGRIGLDTPTPALATVDVNFIFVGNIDEENGEFTNDLVDEIVEHLDDHYVDTENMESISRSNPTITKRFNANSPDGDDLGQGQDQMQNGMSSVRFNFQAHVIRLGPRSLAALERVMESNSYERLSFQFDEFDSYPQVYTNKNHQASSSLSLKEKEYNHIRFVDANAMSEAVDSLAERLGLQNETNLFIMDLKPKHIGQDIHYGYRGDVHILTEVSNALKRARIRSSQTQDDKKGKISAEIITLSNVSRILLDNIYMLENDKRRTSGFKSRQWDVELSTKTKISTSSEFDGENVLSDPEEEQQRKERERSNIRTHPSIQKLYDAGELWGSEMLFRLESDDEKLDIFLDLDKGDGKENDDEAMSGNSTMDMDTAEENLTTLMLKSLKLPKVKGNTVHTLRMLEQADDSTYEESMRTVGECAVDAWVSSSRSAWIDVGSGPFQWGPTVGGRGIKLGKGQRHVIPTLASFLHSLIIKHGREEETLERMNVPQHISVRFFVVDGHGQKYEPLDFAGERNGGFDLEGFRTELERLVLPDQTFSFVIGHLDMDEDPDIGVAFVKSLRTAVTPTINLYSGELESRTYRYVDSKVIHNSLKNDKRRLGYQNSEGGKQKKSIILPVFLFSVGGNTPTFIDTEGLQAKAMDGMVLVVQSESEVWKSTVSCNGESVSQSLRNPAKAALLATLELWGKVDLISNKGSSSLSKDDWSWSVGNTIFSRINPSPGLLLSQLQIDSFHRATISHVLAASHVMQRKAYKTIRAARSLLGEHQQAVINDLHGVELQLFTCWNTVISHVRFLDWNAAFKQLNPLLRKSRLLLKAANRVATEAKISCEYMDDDDSTVESNDDDSDSTEFELETRGKSGEEDVLGLGGHEESDKELYELRVMLSMFVLATICLFFGVVYYWCCHGKNLKHWLWSPTSRTGTGIYNPSYLPTTNKGLEDLEWLIRRRKPSRQKLH